MKKGLTLEDEIEAKIIDEKGWRRLRECSNKANLDPECELCLRASLYDRLLMSDEWRRVCPDCFDGMPKLVNNQLYATDEIGYLKVKDKKARKEIKELKAEVEDLKKELHYLEVTVNLIKKIQKS